MTEAIQAFKAGYMPKILYVFVNKETNSRFFETEGKNINTMKFIDRLNLHCKVGALLNIFFTEEEKNLVKEVESTETFEDSVEVTKKICEYMKDKLEEIEKEVEGYIEGEEEKLATENDIEENVF